MHSANSIINRLNKILFTALFTFLTVFVFGQENSPYSRYGIGDLTPNQNIVNRGMGGISIGYSDYGLLGSPFNINFINPAALGNISNTGNFSNTIFDVGTELDFRTLKNSSTAEKYNSKNLVISYMELAFPFSTKKMEKKGTAGGLSFGLRPISRINYKIEQSRRSLTSDSIHSLYEGNGGMNQINISAGFKKRGNGPHKNEFSFGLSSGFSFGTKDYSTKTSIINDTVPFLKSNFEVKSRFYGLFFNAGIQYAMHIENAGTLRLGGYFDLNQKLTARQSKINETFTYDFNGSEVMIDSISVASDVKGKIMIPSSYGIGFTYQSKNKQWLFGADYEVFNWGDYRYYDETDYTQNNWIVRMGAEYYPAKSNGANRKYSDYIKYRAGFYYGPDYIKLTESRNNYAITGGFSLPLTTPRYIQSRGEYVTLNSSFEVGSRGGNVSAGIKENFTRINVGLSMNARWFQKRSYD